MTFTTASRSSAGLLWAFLGLTACTKASDPVGLDAASGVDIMAPTDRAVVNTAYECGGTFQCSGTAPGGPFAADSMTIIYYYDASRLEIVLLDSSHRAELTIDIPVDRSTDAGIMTGAQTVTVFYNSAPSLATSVAAMFDITTADGLLSGGGHGWGRIVATFEIDVNGFSIVGSFDSPFCARIAPA